jgi:molecular chaperone DnaK
MSTPIVGIDLGTTNSVVSILQDKHPQTILVDGAKLLPSVVSLTDEGFIVGRVAKNMAILEPERTVSSVKRKMGQNTELAFGDRKMRPEEVSALILKKLRQAALEHLKLGEGAALRAVITVPAYFTEEQRGATKQAAEMVDLKVERIINEPTSAALAFGMSQLESAIYAVYDFGGGTFDVSVIESNDGLVEVLSTAGDNQLGGDDLDQLFADWLWERFLKKNNLSGIQRSRKEDARLLRIAEQTKIKLSGEKEVAVQEGFFLKHKDMNYHLEQTVSRDDFENLIQQKVQQTVHHVRSAVDDARLETSALDGILLVGGSSRIPLISNMIEQQVGIVPVLIDLPDEAVSHGATIQGAIIDKVEVDTVLVDITPHSLGIGTLDDRSYDTYYLVKTEEDRPDLRAAAIIAKNTPVPVRRTRTFYSCVEYQKEYHIEIFQGEKPRFFDNKTIGETTLEVSSPVEDGIIDVTFELDLNGLLKVTAIETTTKEKVKTEFKSSRGVRMQKSQLEEAPLVSGESANAALLKRAETLFDNGKLAGDDRKDLQELLDRYRRQLAMGETEDAHATESELLDMLYYLEEGA